MYQKLEDKEKNILNMIENESVRIKAFSVYSYFVKHSAENKISKSIAKFFNMYKRYHNDPTKNVLTEKYFSKIVYQLIDMKLIATEKVGRTNTYILATRTEAPVVDSVVDSVGNKKVLESIDNTRLESNFENTQIYNTKLNTNTNTLYTTSEVVAPIELVNVAKKFLKENKVKSKLVVNAVIEKLRNCMNINKAGMMKYIETVVLEKISIYKQQRANINSAYAKNYYSKIKESAKTIQFTNYPQREYSEEFYDNLENEALGLC
ncbi:MAG: hypothetical protein ACRCUM_04190 [Mycoplasmoidaceae bacterium]